MTNRRRTVALVSAAAIALAAVSGGVLWDNRSTAQAENTEQQVQEKLANVAKTDAETGDKVFVDTQAQVIKELGEAGKLTVDGQKKSSFEITVHSVKVMKSCTLRGFGDKIKPENGTFLVLDVSAELDASATKVVDEDIALMPLDASVFGASSGENNKVSYGLDTVASYSCDVKNALDIAVGAGTKVRGNVVLDSPYGSGQVVYDPEKSGGWTWTY